MTSPDGQGLPDPGSGWNGLGLPGLGSFLINSMVVRPLSKLLSLFTGRPPEDFDTQAELEAEANNVIAGFMGWLTNLPIIGDLIKAVTGVTVGLVGGMLTIANTFLNRWTQLNNTEAQANNAVALANIAQNTVDDLSLIVAASKATQAGVGNTNDMATVPRALLIAWDADGNKYLPSYQPQCPKFTSAGRVYFTPIIVDREGNLDKLRFITGADSSLFGIDNYFIALMIWDIPANVFKTVWNPGDIKSSMGSARSEVSISMGLTGAAAKINPQQILVVAHQQVAPGTAQAARSIAWVPQSGIARTTDVLLRGCYWQTPVNWGAGIPPEIYVPDLQLMTDGIPWYAVSVNN